TTATIGSLAVAAGLADHTGLVSELAPVQTAAAPITFDSLVTGGYDPSDVSVVERAESLAAAGVFPLALVAALREELIVADERVKAPPQGGSQREIADAIEQDLRRFQAEYALARVVVVDVSNTEPPVASAPELSDLAALESALDAGESPLP